MVQSTLLKMTRFKLINPWMSALIANVYVQPLYYNVYIYTSDIKDENNLNYFTLLSKSSCKPDLL